MSKDMIKECEENCINIANEMTDMLKVINAMQSWGNHFMPSNCGRGIKEQYFAGLSEIRNAIYAQYVEMLSRCFVFVGVGGEKAKEYSRQKFHEQFGEEDRYCVTHFLDKYGQVLGWCKPEDEKLLRKQASELMDNE